MHTRNVLGMMVNCTYENEHISRTTLHLRNDWQNFVFVPFYAPIKSIKLLEISYKKRNYILVENND